MMLDTLLKWVATVVLIIGQFVNSLGYYPAGPILFIVGGALWLIVSVIWREPSLIVTNGVMLLAGVVGLMVNYL